MPSRQLSEETNMKCPFCKKNTLEVYQDEMEEDGIPFEAFRCISCKEEFLDMKQLDALADQYKRIRKAKEVTFSQWGNSIAVRIPHEIAHELHIKSGKHGLITKDKEGIKILVH